MVLQFFMVLRISFLFGFSAFPGVKRPGLIGSKEVYSTFKIILFTSDFSLFKQGFLPLWIWHVGTYVGNYGGNYVWKPCFLLGFVAKGFQ